MVNGRRARAAEACVSAGALAGGAVLVWIAVRAVQHRAIPTWALVFLASLTAVGGLLALLTGGRYGDPHGALRHSSGELVIVRGYRERRRRGTRIALDWKYSLRDYVFPPFALMFAFFGGIDLIEHGAGWQQVLGALAMVGAIATTAALVRWLLLPVDPDAKACLDAYYEDMRWDWGAVRRRMKARRARNRP